MQQAWKNLTYIRSSSGPMFIGPTSGTVTPCEILNAFPGGINGLMKEHAKLLKPKILIIVQKAVARTRQVQARDLEQPGRWLFHQSESTSNPSAKRAVALCKELAWQ